MLLARSLSRRASNGFDIVANAFNAIEMVAAMDVQ
jgi:hypothetical protein